MNRMEYLRQWRRNNPDKCKIHDEKSRLRMRAYHYTEIRKSMKRNIEKNTQKYTQSLKRNIVIVFEKNSRGDGGIGKLRIGATIKHYHTKREELKQT